uniref:Uncharacterized protein n=1 Tax=Oryza punctata TaxID=4537 RepID=A0A0E0M9V1_ORYPU
MARGVGPLPPKVTTATRRPQWCLWTVPRVASMDAVLSSAVGRDPADAVESLSELALVTRRSRGEEPEPASEEGGAWPWSWAHGGAPAARRGVRPSESISRFMLY